MATDAITSVTAAAQTMGGRLLRKLNHLTEGKLDGRAVRVVWSLDGLAAFAGITALLLGGSAVRNPVPVEGYSVKAVQEDQRNRFILVLFALCLAGLTSAVITQRYLPNMFGVKV